MRLPVSHILRAPVRAALLLVLASGVAACATSSGQRPVQAAHPAVNGPQADFPALVGPAYTIGDQAYTPIDVLNYDQVGFLAVDQQAMGYSGAHHTLPVPSYAEVTSLESGRTILVRLERRGPMNSHHLVALSPAALAQLEAGPETPIRMRRVNPPEEQRALLRGGNAAPLRMDTPMSLVAVLRRRLPVSDPVTAPAEPAGLPVAPVDLSPAPVELAVIDPDAVDVSPEIPAIPPSPVVQGGFVVQAAAFSNPDNARRAANVLGGSVSQSGNFYRVQTGPFATRGEAEASLANVRRAGYSDARILTSG